MLSFIQFLKTIDETPMVDTRLSHDTIENSDGGAEMLRSHNQYIHDNHKDKINCIGNNSFHHSDENYHHYYHLNNGKVHEVNLITKDNQQVLASKGNNNGDGKIVRKHMVHHIKTHGELKSDGTQSIGGRDLWKNFIKSKPKGVAFEVSHLRGKFKVDHNNIVQKENEIWSVNSPLKSFHIIRAFRV